MSLLFGNHVSLFRRYYFKLIIIGAVIFALLQSKLAPNVVHRLNK